MPDPPKRRERRPLKPGPLREVRDGTPAPATRLRELFRAARILERVESGELDAVVTSQNEPNPQYNQPEGTVSQTITYFDKDRKQAAQAHQFLLSDGSIGGSGKPDPKRVLYEGVLYYLDR
jgi:hypothetical protein